MILIILIGCSAPAINDKKIYNKVLTANALHDIKTSRIDLSILSDGTDFNDIYLAYSKENAYFASYEDNSLLINKVSYSDYEVDTIYKNTKDISSKTPPIITYSEVINDSLVIGEAYHLEKGFSFILREIDLKYFEAKVLYEKFVSKLPYISETGSNVFINYETWEEDKRLSTLDMINLNTGISENIASKEAKISADGLLFGELIVYAGGLDENGVYYQVLELNGETIEESKIQWAYYYNIQDKLNEGKFELEQKVVFLTGNKNILITSDYSFDDPNVLSGKIHTLSFNADKINPIETKTIDNIAPGNDILNCKQISDNLVFTTASSIYTYNINNGLLNTYYFKESGSRLYSKISFSGNNLAFIETQSEKIALILIQFDISIDQVSEKYTEQTSTQIGDINKVESFSIDNRSFEIETEPENEYEEIVCYWFIQSIAGAFDKKLMLVDPQNKELKTDIEKEKEDFEKNLYIVKYIINAVGLLKKPEIALIDDSMFQPESIAEKYGLHDFEIVEVKYFKNYSDDYYNLYPSGRKTIETTQFIQYFLIGSKEENGEKYIYTYSMIQ